MSTTAETGRMGECAAVDYLRCEGYEIRDVNWRNGRYELDIVALHNGLLHIVEVKTRRAGALTPPEAAITQQKCRALNHAAACYMAYTGWKGDVQFDLVAVEIGPNGDAQVELVESAIESNW